MRVSSTAVIVKPLRFMGQMYHMPLWNFCARWSLAPLVATCYGSTSTPRQKATHPLILRAADLGSG